MAPPTKLTAELQTRIVNMILAGCYPEVAAGACDVPRSTFFEWMQRGLGQHPTRKATRALSAFAHTVMTAVDKAEVRLVLRLAEYEEGTRPSKRAPGRRAKSTITMSAAIAMQWRLSRRFPDRWGQRPAVAMNVGVGMLPSADAPEQDTRPVIQIVYARDDDDDDDAPAYPTEGSPEADRELARLKADDNQQADRARRFGMGHPCPEELGADVARARR